MRPDMQAMVLTRAAAGAVEARRIPRPEPGPGQILVRIAACGVCRTDLHVVDGELRDPKLPLVPGHEIVGRIEGLGSGVTAFATGDRVGIPWLASSCGACEFCRSGRENLCRDAAYTGYHVDGGYAEYAVADARFCFAIPERYDDVHAAPLMCAGLIGYRALRMAGDAHRIGIYGFGAAAHIVAQLAVGTGREVYAFVRPGDEAARQFALAQKVTWAGGSTDGPPAPLDAALIFAPAGQLVPEALSRVAPGGTVVCAGIHMSDIPAFPYRLLWEERSIRSVANLTREDAREFLALADRVPIATTVRPYRLAEANAALASLRRGEITGAAVLTP